MGKVYHLRRFGRFLRWPYIWDGSKEDCCRNWQYCQRSDLWYCWACVPKLSRFWLTARPTESYTLSVVLQCSGWSMKGLCPSSHPIWSLDSPGNCLIAFTGKQQNGRTGCCFIAFRVWVDCCQWSTWEMYVCYYPLHSFFCKLRFLWIMSTQAETPLLEFTLQVSNVVWDSLKWPSVFIYSVILESQWAFVLRCRLIQPFLLRVQMALCWNWSSWEQKQQTNR